MSSNARLRGLEKDLELAEAAYETYLRAELQTCALGHWACLASTTLYSNTPRNEPHSARARKLVAMSEEIGDFRARLGFTEPYALHEKYVAYRKMAKAANAQGEPKLAKRFLEELDSPP